MEFEDILSEVGDFGPYQKKLLLYFMAPTTFATAFYVMNVIFLVAVPNHWCHIPEFEETNLTIEEQKILSVPKVVRNGEEQYSRCTMYNLDYTAVLRNVTWFNGTTVLPKLHSHHPVQSCQNGWVYDRTLYQQTAATRWNLVCDYDSLSSLVLTLSNVGSVMGALIFGAIADKLGRRNAFFMNIIVAIVCGVLSVFAPNFSTFAILRMLVGGTLPSNFQLPYILTVEQVGSTVRSRLVCFSWILWTLGSCCLALVAFLSRSWVTLALVTSLPTALFLAYWKFLTFSPRFLIAHGRYDEAGEVLKHIAITNKKEVPSDLLVKVLKVGQTLMDHRREESTHSVLDIFRYPQLRKKLIIVTLIWTAISVTYFGLIINISNLGGNDFLNYFCLSVVELPAFFIGSYIMDKWGRRWASTGFILIAGFFCLLPVFLPANFKSPALAASLIGKFCSAAGFMVIYQQAAELYPTAVRSIGIAIGSTVSAIAIICMPYIVYLGSYNKYIPFLFIGGMCLVAGLLAPLVPETLNESLPQTIEDSEAFGLKQKMFYLARKRNNNEQAVTTQGGEESTR